MFERKLLTAFKYISVVGIKDIGIAGKEVETDDAKLNGFESADPRKASENIGVAEGNHEIKDVKLKVGDGFTAVKNIPQITVLVTGESSKKTFRDVGTDVPEEFLLNEVGGAAKKCVSKSSFLDEVI